MKSVNLCLLLTIVLQSREIHGLDCYQCLHINNTSSCHTLITCPVDNLCSTESFNSGNDIRFTLKCKPKQDCMTAASSQSLIGRRQTTGNPTCSQCCSKHACNGYLCSAGTHNVGITSECLDDPTFDCAHMSEVFSICSDIHHAKLVCRDFCGLCNLVDGSWSIWGAWAVCDVTCGNGTILRTRTCSNPSPANGGLDCTGPNSDSNTCQLSTCPVAGGWSDWSTWGYCSVPCGIGLRRRDRSCSNPYPEHLGDHCFGDDKIYEACFEKACADGNWTSWSSWGTCSASCGTGQQSRIRQCTNPVPSQFGRDCVGNNLDEQLCNIHNCPDTQVAFSVNTPTGLNVSGVPTFRHATINTGSYNMNTGKFVCPIAGIYTFTVTVRHDSADSGDVYCFIRKNGIILVHAGATLQPGSSGSQIVIVQLGVSDIVDLSCHDWNHVYQSSSVGFTGVLSAVA